MKTIYSNISSCLSKYINKGDFDYTIYLLTVYILNVYSRINIDDIYLINGNFSINYYINNANNKCLLVNWENADFSCIEHELAIFILNIYLYIYTIKDKIDIDNIKIYIMNEVNKYNFEKIKFFIIYKLIIEGNYIVASQMIQLNNYTCSNS